MGTALERLVDEHDESRINILKSMRILHFYRQENEMQARYVSMLAELMSGNVEFVPQYTLADVKKALTTSHYDILHIHGCWSIQYAKAAALAQRVGTRIVISPHGELEPWILRERQWQEKMPKTLLYQRQSIQEAYVIIAMGSMEHDSLEKLGWNPRIETIRNALITHSISPEEMSRQLLTVYRKVMDSDVIHVMNEKTREALFLLLKAAAAGSKQWMQGQEPSELSDDEWRQLFIYARHEQLENWLKRGISVLSIREPLIDVSHVQSYYPATYSPVKTISETIGNKFVSENERLLATFKYLHRLMTAHQLAMSHMIELEREIREHDIDEEMLMETLKENRLQSFAQRLMGVLAHFTHLEEGMMPVPAISDKQTEKLQTIITNRLKI